MYTLDKLLKDIVQKRAKVKDGDGAQLDYREAWNCFQRYLKSCLEQKRGLHLGALCKVGWQAERKAIQTANSKASYRPVFQVTEQFCRSYCNQEALRKLSAGGGGQSELCPFEEFNFSKAAIKFSNQMTKDQVFTGIRAITQQLGEAIAAGQDADIEFGDIGRLVCKEREPRFHFSPAVYESEGMEAPPPMAAMDEDVPRSGAAFSKRTPSAAMGLGVQGSNAQAKRKPTPMPPPMEEDDYYGGGDMDYGATDMGAGYPQEDYAQQRPMSGSSSAPSLAVNGTPGARTHVLTGQQFKREVAFKEAMDRHIGEMESRAGEAMKERQAWSRHVGDCLSQERDDIQVKRVRMRENQHFVQQQKLLNEEKRKEQRQEDIISSSAHDFPKFTEPAESDMKDFIHGQQARMRADLDEQVRTNSTLKNLSKQRERAMEVNQLEANRAEMRMLRDAERAKKSYDKEALATAWNSEIRMKNIWKAIDSHNKVGTEEPQVMEVASSRRSMPPSRGGESTRSAGRLMTGSSRKVPGGASGGRQALQMQD